MVLPHWTAFRRVLAIGLAASSWGAFHSAAEDFKPTQQDTIVPAGAKVEVLWNEGEFTEGPAPDGQGRILFSDIGNRILRFDPSSGQTSVFRDPSGKSNGLKFDPRGNLIACEGAAPGGNRRISLTDPQGNVRTLVDRFEGKRFNSPNDLAITTSGNIYFTDPRYVGDEPRELDFEGVFLVTPDGKVTVATRDVQKPNGIIVTPDDKTVYVADNNNASNGNHQLVAFTARVDGTLADKRMLHDFGANRGIDGMTIDIRGNIYATAGSGPAAGIYVFGPQGEERAFIATPAEPSNCVFGSGPESATLYITGAGPTKPQAGAKRTYALYRVVLKTPGYHVFPAR
jgi:sugar lactone lactonase YvrE